MAKRGRPLIELNQEEFEKLCGIQCSLTELAEWFRVSEDTIERWCKRTYGENFAEVFNKKRSRGKISLRRKMFEAALNGNVTLMIWLSKQYLGFADKVEAKNEVQQKDPHIVYVAEWGGKPQQ